MTKLIITLSLIFSVMHISSLLAEDLVIAAGKEGGGYHKKAEEIAVRLEQRGHDVEVVNYNGSDEITLAMCKGEAQIGIGQIGIHQFGIKQQIMNIIEYRYQI